MACQETTYSIHYKYAQYIVKHNSFNDFIKVYFLHCFVRHVSALVMNHLQADYFSSKVKYTISNAIVTYEISYNIYKKF